jgi:centromere-localized protein 2
MAPTETSILTNFLITPAPLNAAISEEQFAELFPRQHKSSEDVQVLYRELSRQIAQGIEEVKANISAEAQRGTKQQRQILKARRKSHQTQIDSLDLQDIQMDLEVLCCLILL